MASQRRVQFSTVVRSCSKKIPTKSVGRLMVLWIQRCSTLSSVEEKVPRRLVSGSAASATSMARFMGTWTVAHIW